MKKSNDQIDLWQFTYALDKFTWIERDHCAECKTEETVEEAHKKPLVSEQSSQPPRLKVEADF